MRKIAFAATLLSLIGSAAWAQIPVPAATPASQVATDNARRRGVSACCQALASLGQGAASSIRRCVRRFECPPSSPASECRAHLREHVAAEHVTPEQRQQEIEDVVTVLRTYLK